jgi:three-Cys-motif partner protein
MFPEFLDGSAERFIDGSAKLALMTEPPFQEYIFIERNSERIKGLEDLRDEYPNKANSVRIFQGDTNDYLIKLCARTNWKGSRALVFLDPYGMQVPWTTLETIARTKAIDLWYLFPLGVAVNRLLTTDGDILPLHQQKLDNIFGTSRWREAFYKRSEQRNIFAEAIELVKQASFDSIEQFFIERLNSIFPYVAKRPYRLYNFKSVPLYSFCFAAANPGRGGEIALRIANHLLKGF